MINELLTIDAEKVDWPENIEPKFTRKRGTKVIKVSYNTKMKRYTYYDNKSVTAGEPIRLDIPDVFLYFSYHLVKKEYIKIDAPSKHKPDAKYVVTAPYCHWIWERNITVFAVLAVLAYATQNAQVTQSNVKTAIKEAPTKEILHQRIAEHECYTELVKTIISAVIDVSQVENPSVNYKEKVDVINGVIKFIREKEVEPSCKLLLKETLFIDFMTAAEDVTTMDSAKGIANTKVPAEEFIKEWRNQHNNIIRSKNKMKQKEYLEKRWGGYLLPPTRDQKDPEMNSVISFGSNTTETSTCQKQQ